jgi:hypothetical protein
VVVVIGKAMLGVDCGSSAADQNGIGYDTLKVRSCA